MSDTNLTPEQLSIARADLLYKLNAATGFLIDAFSSLEDLNNGKSPFSMGLKNTAVKFQAQLAAHERFITSFGGDPEGMDQMANSYELMNLLLNVALLAGRTLTPAAQQLLHNELEEVCRKWGVYPKV